MDVKKKDEATNNLLKELSKCRRCRFCLDVCPLYQVAERNESMSAYGRLQTLKLLLNGTLDPDDSVIYPIYTCLQCSRCNVVCKSKGQDLEVSELIRLGKSLVTKNLLDGSKK